ncbi:MAG: ABC transporter permease [Bdellovibrionota bacterium]|nr:MAG: ABC transporter permease [Bdellovibrionota bacterium]
MSRSSFSRIVALRYLWSKRSEAFISIITFVSIAGVAIGVMVLTIVMAVMTGFERELRDKIVDANSHILVRHTSGVTKDWRVIAEQIRSVPGIASVSPYSQHQALIQTEHGSAGLLIRGVAPGSAAERDLARYVQPAERVGLLYAPPAVGVNRPDGSADQVVLPGLIIGRELQRNYGIFVGSPVSILSSETRATPLGLAPKFRRFVVVAVYKSGLVEYESGLAYVSLEEAQRFFGLGDAVTGFELRVDALDKAPAIAQQVLKILGGPAAGFYVQDWTELNRPLWEALKLEKKVYFIVLLLIIIMASFSIVTTLIMIVLEKRKDIAILQTLGASSAAISKIFQMLGAVIGAVGTLFGVLLGYLGCVALKEYGFPIDERIFQMSTVPVRIEPLNFLMVAAAAFGICFLATLYPARRASQLHPSEVLRYE